MHAAFYSFMGDGITYDLPISQKIHIKNMKTIFSFAFIALATVQGSQAGSSLTVVNQTPIVKNGATIYDPVAQANISVFGASCPAGGCLINGGSSKTFENIAPEDPTNYLFGK